MQQEAVSAHGQLDHAERVLQRAHPRRELCLIRPEPQDYGLSELVVTPSRHLRGHGPVAAPFAMTLMADQAQFYLRKPTLKLGSRKSIGRDSIALNVPLIRQPLTLADVAPKPTNSVVGLGDGEVAVFGVRSAHLRAIHELKPQHHTDRDAPSKLLKHGIQEAVIVVAKARDDAEVERERHGRSHGLTNSRELAR